MFKEGKNAVNKKQIENLNYVWDKLSKYKRNLIKFGFLELALENIK